MALEKVTNARFIAKTASNVTVAFDSTAAIKPTTVAELVLNGTVMESVSAIPHANSDMSGTATFSVVNSETFDFSAEYIFRIQGMPSGATVSKAAFLDDADFIEIFENKDTLAQEYGAAVDNGRTRFCVWAPFATSIKVKLYDGVGFRTIALEKRIANGVWGGVWRVDVPGELHGVYYNFLVTNGGAEIETVDPYAKACDANGARGMIVDLRRTDPDGWDDDKHLYMTDRAAADTPIVWELHVADFSVSPDSGMKYKGKYLAFTERDTAVPGKPELKTGIEYLKDLGVTYVQLNPVFDFATVDEGDLGKADNTKDNFNWGYDPQNYNIPEGSYATDPDNGVTRIMEFKQMVMALHKAGIGVVMDVVYNHTYSTSGQALHDTVPGYYHRTDANGEFTNGSGCGNETASERGMMRKYMMDSIVYWASEYHIDGFRFDLMGLHDRITIEKIREKLDAVCGREILMYGEPWSADGAYVPDSFIRRITASGECDNELIKNCDLSKLPLGVAVFNDECRDGMRGNNDPGAGWVHGNTDKTGSVAAMLNAEAKGLGAASHNVVYASAHDNYTLWDQVIGVAAGKETPLFYESAMDYAVERCKLVSAAYLMSPGIAFMLAGEEMGRTKYGNHNSYNSPVKLNRITWSRQEEFKDLTDHYKALIKARRNNRAELFSYDGSRCEQTDGRFTANGLTVCGSRGALSLRLSAEDDETNYVEINGKTVVSF